MSIIESIEEIHKEDVVLVKIGKFYHTYGRDSYIISYLFNYKLKSNGNMSECGFSENCLNKVISKLESKKINYLVTDRRNNYDVDEKIDNKNLNKYNEYFNKAKKYVNYKNRIDSITKFMLNNIEKENCKELLNKMEEVVNERRKV